MLGYCDACKAISSQFIQQPGLPIIEGIGALSIFDALFKYLHFLTFALDKFR
jgi:hypothetical protein